MKWDTRARKHRIADATSRLLNVLLFDGMPDESISGRAWREPPSRKWDMLGRIANAIYRDPDHCRKAHEQSLERAKRRVRMSPT